MLRRIGLIAVCVGVCAIEKGWAQAHHDHGQATAVVSGPTPSAPGATVYFVNVKSGDTLQRQTLIRFGLRNMVVARAGTPTPNSGHHHLLIDSDLPPLDEPVPSDENHLHFGAAQTEATITLTPGEHTLQLVLGDKDHVPHNPPVMSEKIKVKVVEPGNVATSTPKPATIGITFFHPISATPARSKLTTPSCNSGANLTFEAWLPRVRAQMSNSKAPLESGGFCEVASA